MGKVPMGNSQDARKKEEEMRKLRKKCQISLPLGLLLFFIARLCKRMGYLGDFAAGFLEGISIALLVVGVVYLLWCLVKKQRPF